MAQFFRKCFLEYRVSLKLFLPFKIYVYETKVFVFPHLVFIERII